MVVDLETVAPSQEASPAQEPTSPVLSVVPQPEASDAPGGVSEAIHLETEEVVLALQPHLTAEQEELETGPVVRCVEESLTVDEFLHTLHTSEIGIESNLQFSDLFDLNKNLVHMSSDILPTLPMCIREGVTLSESVSEQPAFEELSELLPGSDIFAYCIENSHIVDIEHLDQQRSSIPVQGEFSESE